MTARVSVFSLARGLFPVLAMASCLVLSFGCGKQRLDPARYKPSVDTSLRALTAAMEHWKSGKHNGEVESDLPVTVMLLNSQANRGQTLQEYEILGEVAGDGVRTYGVRVRLTNPTTDERIRFYIVGIDPIWVWHQEDYEMVTRWEDAMPERQTEVPETDPSAIEAKAAVLTPAEKG